MGAVTGYEREKLNGKWSHAGYGHEMLEEMRRSGCESKTRSSV